MRMCTSCLSPTRHVGLVMGKGKTKLLHFVAEQADLELQGVPGAVLVAEEMVGRAVQRQVRLVPGRWRCCLRGVRDEGCKTFLVYVMDTVFLDRELLVGTWDVSDSDHAQVFSMDCEWVYTSRGGELARVTAGPCRGCVL